MPLGISVVICCYNSSARIAPTLEHLYNQEDIYLSSWEIILVDNLSTDDTVQVASTLWAGFVGKKPPFRIVKENSAGLSNARKKGISESVYDYVLFCDDDNWLNKDYLNTALSILQANGAIGALGGWGSPMFEKSEPPFFWENQYHALAVGRQSKISGDITNERGVLYGAGMIINKTAFNILLDQFRFDFLVSDRKGSSLLSSGDHELCLALRRIGYKIYYSDLLQFGHYIPASRTTISYYKKLFFGFGISYALLLPYRTTSTTSYAIKNDYRYLILRCLKNIIRLQVRLFLSGYYFDRNKHKYLGLIHSLKHNTGALITYLEIKNQYKKKISGNPLFN